MLSCLVRSSSLRAFVFFFILSLGGLMGIVPAQAASAIPFSIGLSEVVTVTGTPRLALDVGGVTRYATYASGSGTSTLTFTYTTQAGDVDLDGITVSSPIDLNGGTITDQAGNVLSVLSFTLPNTAGIKVNHPSLSMDFVNNDYILNGTHYATLPSFLTAAGGSFTRASIGTYFDSSGILQTATSGTPRFDYDPVTHVAKGILIEEARTNTLANSADFSNASCIKTGVTVNTNVVTAPDNSMTADKIIDTSTTGQFGISMPNISITAGSSWSASLYAKAAENNYIYLWLDNGSGYGITFECNLLTGATRITRTDTAHYSNISTFATSVGDGWWRIGVAGTTSLTNIQMRAYMSPTPWVAANFGTPTYTGTGSSGMYLWGAQLEQGAFSTSYIPTTTVAIARAADVLTVPSAGWFNATEGTFAAQFDLSAFSPNRQYVFSPPSGDIGFDRLNIRGADVSGAVPPSGVVGNGSNAVSTLIVAGAGIVNGTEKVVLNYSATASAFSRNGSAVQTGGNYSGSARANFQLGANGSSSSQLAGHIALFRYYPLSVANSQIPLLTQ